MMNYIEYTVYEIKLILIIITTMLIILYGYA